MARLPQVGGDVGNWGEILNDFLRVEHNTDGSHAIKSILITDIKAFGAIGDGVSHPLSQKFSTLDDAKKVYPHATALSDETDWAAWQGAVNQATTGIRIQGGERTYMFNRTLDIANKANVHIIGNFGGRPNRAPNLDGGTIIKWNGSQNTSIIRIFNAEMCSLEGLHIRGQGYPNLIGILIDSDNNPATHEIDLLGIAIDHCGVPGSNGVGIQIGSSVSTNQMDNIRISRFRIINCADGIVINGVNCMDTSIIENGYFTKVVSCIRSRASGYFSVINVAGSVFEENGVGFLSVEGDHNPIMLNSINIEPHKPIVVVTSPAGSSSDPITVIGGLGAGARIDTIGQQLITIGVHMYDNVVLNGAGSVCVDIANRWAEGKGIVRKGSGSQLVSMNPNQAAPVQRFESNSEGPIVDFRAGGPNINPGITLTNPGPGGKTFALLVPGTGGVNPGGFSLYADSTNVIDVQTPHVHNTLRLKNGVIIPAALQVAGNVGFYNTVPQEKKNVIGSKGGNSALASLIEQLAALGLITNSTTG